MVSDCLYLVPAEKDSWPKFYGWSPAWGKKFRRNAPEKHLTSLRILSVSVSLLQLKPRLNGTGHFWCIRLWPDGPQISHHKSPRCWWKRQWCVWLLSRCRLWDNFDSLFCSFFRRQMAVVIFDSWSCLSKLRFWIPSILVSSCLVVCKNEELEWVKNL